jgi:hypothetical protein
MEWFHLVNKHSRYNLWNAVIFILLTGLISVKLPLFFYVMALWCSGVKIYPHNKCDLNIYYLAFIVNHNCTFQPTDSDTPSGQSSNATLPTSLGGTDQLAWSCMIMTWIQKRTKTWLIIRNMQTSGATSVVAYTQAGEHPTGKGWGPTWRKQKQSLNKLTIDGLFMLEICTIINIIMIWIAIYWVNL